MKKSILKIWAVCLMVAFIAGVVIINGDKDKPGPIGENTNKTAYYL